MTLDNDSSKPDETGAIVLARIDSTAKCLKHWKRNQAGCPTPRAAAEFLTYEVSNHRCHAFAGFERDVADESITHDDVRGASIDVVTFDESDVVNITGRQKPCRFLDTFVALDLFLADVEQADRGPRNVVHRAH